MARFLFLILVLIPCLLQGAVSAAAGSAADASAVQVDCAPPSDFEPHDAIDLRNSASLLIPDAVSSSGIRSGAGTADDPYVISRWYIAVPDDSFALRIGDLDEHIVVEDLVLSRTEWTVPRDYDALAAVYGSPNVTIRSIWLTGAASQGLMLFGTFQNPVERLWFSLRDDDPVEMTKLGIQLSDFEGTLRHINFCGEGLILTGGTYINRKVVVSDVKASADARLIVPHAEEIRLSEIHGPVWVSIQALDDAQIEVRDSSLHLVSHSMKEGEASHFAIDNVSLNRPQRDSSWAALSIDNPGGEVRISNITVTRPVTRLLSAYGASVTVVDNVLRTSDLTQKDELPIRLGCATEFSRNDVYRGADDELGLVMEVRGCTRPVTGTGNYFNGHEPALMDRDWLRPVDEPRLGLVGSFDFQDSRSEPNHPEASPPADQVASTPTIGFVPLAAGLLLLGSSVRRRAVRLREFDSARIASKIERTMWSRTFAMPVAS